MHVHSTTVFGGPKLPTTATFLQRLAARLTQESAAPAEATPGMAGGPTTLTTAMLRATLLEMGAAADAQNLALAEAFAHLGLPLTRESLAQAHMALAGAPQTSPLAYALARAWSLPATPAVLRALTAVTGGDEQAAPEQALPSELMSWLGLTADAGMEPETLAAHLFVMAQGMGQSTEHRLASRPAGHQGALETVRDTRTTLLRLAQGSADRAIRRGADALAAHIEGQQLVNQAARRAGETPDAPFYLAVPLQLGSAAALAEMRLWPWDDEKDADEMPPDTPFLRATLRLATARLGRVQADIAGTLAGTLTCRLGAERPATARLLQRRAGTLAAALAALGGWRATDVQCGTKTDWPPLWHGGHALAGPRPCVDWRA
ncbi:MAG: flagellar hook-length control protein FliK [Armatimonadetes bacterium]|nr:flagellar hook-length control protein FliK [Armatimonadota bacterium]